MGWMRGRVRQLRALFRKAREDRELDAEVRFHVDMETEKNLRLGMDADEARRRALIAFGGTERMKEEVRAARWTRWIEDLLADARYAVRALARRPGFTAAAVTTLALGIGGTTAVFSVVEGVLLRPLPYRDPGRVVRVDAGMGVMGEVLALRGRVAAFADVEAYGAFGALSLTGSGEPERLASAAVTPGLFPLLGVEAALGRTFLAKEDEPGSDDVVILSHGLWIRRFGGDRSIVGRRIVLDGVSRAVVGVMPAGFHFPNDATEAWIPVVTAGLDPGMLWGAGGYRKVARLRPDATPEGAALEVASLESTMRALLPWAMPDDYWKTPSVVPLRDALVGGVRPTLLILLGAVGLLLLVACANVANLLLSRAAARREEIAVRAALGARRARLVRQLLTESLVLGLLGGVSGLALAVGAVASLRRAFPPELPRLGEVAIDGRVLAFALAASLATGLLFGLVPALRASRSGGGTFLEGTRAGGGTRERHRLSGVLVAGQIAVSTVLVIAAGLLVRSLGRLLEVDPGFRAGSVVVATVAPPAFRYPEAPDRVRFYDALLERLASLPGAATVAVGSGVPFGGDAYGSVFLIEGRPDPSATGDWPQADARLTVSADYFRALGIPVLAGRPFTAADRAEAPGVAVVSAALAHRYWPGQDPIGQRLRLVFDPDWRTVVGVVGDVKWSELSDQDGPALYVPLDQGPTGPMRVVVRAAGAPAAVAGRLRDVVTSVDPDTPVSDVRTGERLLSDALAQPRSATGLLAVFAALALALGAVGTYGVTAYAVSRRMREYGIRLALGAPRKRLLWLVLRRGALLAAVGIGLGLVGALAATRLLSGVLFGVSPLDPLTFAAVPLLLAAAVLAASWLPARQALRADPVRVLGSE